ELKIMLAESDALPDEQRVKIFTSIASMIRSIEKHGLKNGEMTTKMLALIAEVWEILWRKTAGLASNFLIRVHADLTPQRELSSSAHVIQVLATAENFNALYAYLSVPDRVSTHCMDCVLPKVFLTHASTIMNLVTTITQLNQEVVSVWETLEQNVLK